MLLDRKKYTLKQFIACHICTSTLTKEIVEQTIVHQRKLVKITRIWENCPSDILMPAQRWKKHQYFEHLSQIWSKWSGAQTSMIRVVTKEKWLCDVGLKDLPFLNCPQLALLDRIGWERLPCPIFTINGPILWAIGAQLPMSNLDRIYDRKPKKPIGHAEL